MPPIYVKGGVWTNVEDEILKAAIAKYGLNQWSRVSSLLSKKTAKQCKQRWEEWLDPRIKKMDWDKKEDEKLLRMIKLRPNQWNSIGILMNRTVNQCIERYQQLLSDTMEGESTDNDLRMVGNFVSKNSDGELNLNAESKPARPDLEEMDDDEKEMLSEARARLANTQGKKAKRKARERMLEESKRISLLQRRRELKQVGINTRIKNKKKYATQMDYNADIAFERRPAEGRFDISEELVRNETEKVNFDRSTNQKGTTNQETAKQKKKEKRQRHVMQKGSSSVNIEGKEELYEEENEESISKRPKLILADANEEGNEEEEAEDIDDRISKATRRIDSKTKERSILFRKRNVEDDTLVKPEIKRVKVGEKRISERKLKKIRKRELAKKLEQLPKPKNNYELIERSSNVLTENVGISDYKRYVDFGEVESEKVRKEQARKELIVELTTSQAVKLQLPIPRIREEVRKKFVKDNVSREMVDMIEKDYKQQVLKKDVKEHYDFDPEKEQKVRKQVERMIAEEGESSEYTKTVLEDKIDTEVDVSLLIELIKSESKVSGNLQEQFESVVSDHLKESQEMTDSLNEKVNKLRQLDQDVETFRILANEEDAAIAVRSQRLQNGIDRMNEIISESRETLLE
ncbi:hypothetical protein FOA43_001245 [Brettanomyces nanus]|uniref:Pre-mRNA-splicing factor CEF1 n=1 Tax=Eeniella nana TaxID=13502 RepID=A0A875RNN2_EENNA|nr:uncharacterized protein FOA43_001245 [Brettanomyces nanus]QPG73930.1 hypothetical protein FOA43_001245 [Brettanomyces nanus]